VPDSPIDSFGDVVRPGLPLEHLPPPEPPATVLQIRHLTRQLSFVVAGALIAGLSAAALTARAVLRRRVRR
jgi:hypothetical protein